MIKRIIITAVLVLFLAALCGCSGKGETPVNDVGSTAAGQSVTDGVNAGEEKTVLKIEVNGHVLYADFEDNSSADALKEKLKDGSITLSMSDYGNFEKVGNLPFSLPRNDSRITTAAGDVILYNGDKLTIYYDVNTWEFTRLAVIRDADSLRTVLGDGDVSVTLSAE